MSAIARPALRYFGGKFRLAPWIISHFPPHVCYCEPFGGAGSVLIRKPPSPVEVYNDIDGDVVTFFRVLRERTDALVRAISLTPYSRAEMSLAFAPTDDLDELEIARRLYVRSWQSRGGPRTQWRSGWRYMRDVDHRHDLIGDWQSVERLWAVAARLASVQIECDEAVRVIRRYDAPGTLHYCDPPYVSGTRGDRWRTKAYRYEMSDADHLALLTALREIRGMAVVSGFDSALYREGLPGWSAVNIAARAETNRPTTETIWLNPAAATRTRQLRLAVPA